MKKFGTLFLIVCMCFVMSACEGQPAGNTPDYNDYSTSSAVYEDNNNNNDNKVEYISDRDVQHYDADKRFTVFFGLKNLAENYVSSSGTADITIYDENDKKIYKKSIKFSEKDFSNWSSGQWNESKYLCGLYIKDKDISHSSAYSGVLALKVTLDDGTWFDEKRMSIYDLPQHEWNDATCTSPKKCKTCGKTEGSAKGHNYYSDGKCSRCGEMDPVVNQTLSKCSLALPALPKRIDYRGYDDDVESTVNVTGITYKFEYEGEGTISLTAYFSGEKTYDYRGSGQSDECKIGWKLYDSNGSVLDTGTFYSPSVAMGESFANQEQTLIYGYKNVPAGAFRLEILDVN